MKKQWIYTSSAIHGWTRTLIHNGRIKHTGIGDGKEEVLFADNVSFQQSRTFHEDKYNSLHAS